MKRMEFIFVSRAALLVAAMFFCTNAFAQPAQEEGGDFWSHVHFGGGVGASFGNRYTDVMLAPGAIYNFNDQFALGVGLQGSYVKVKGDYFSDELNNYKSWIYGGSLIGLFSPIDEVQLSAELEQVRVNTTFTFDDAQDIQDNFWNTALFLGAGYRIENVTIGVRYNVLYDEDKSVYAEPFMPFVRAYF